MFARVCRADHRNEQPAQPCDAPVSSRNLYCFSGTKEFRSFPPDLRDLPYDSLRNRLQDIESTSVYALASIVQFAKCEFFANFKVLEKSNDETYELDFDRSFRAGNAAGRLRPRHAVPVAGSERRTTNSHTVTANPERAAQHHSEHQRSDVQRGLGLD